MPELRRLNEISSNGQIKPSKKKKKPFNSSKQIKPPCILEHKANHVIWKGQEGNIYKN